MIRLIQRQLIIPRGDTGTLSIPILPEKSYEGSAAVLTIFDTLQHRKIFDRRMQVSDTVLTYNFSHGDTVNLPIGKYVWDIKFYTDAVFVDEELVDGTEVDSYHAAFSLPICEIRETGDNLLMADDTPNSKLDSESINIAKGIIIEAADAKQRAEAAASHAEEIAEGIATDLNLKADKTDTLLYTTLSRGRKDNTTVGVASIAFGESTEASGTASQAVGLYTIASGTSASAEGNSTTASGQAAHAEGYGGIASGSYSHKEGYNSTAGASNSHAEGDTTQALSNGAHSEGYFTTVAPNSEGGHAEGYHTTVAGIAAHAEGSSTQAYSDYTHAEGHSTQAVRNYAHAEGYRTVAAGSAAHSEGNQTVAEADSAHAEGAYTQATGSYAHAEGCGTQASGYEAHAEGYYTVASGTASHASGLGTIANANFSYVIGLYNKEIDIYPNWINGQSYNVKDRVIYNNESYECIVANSSSNFINAQWKIINPKSDIYFVVGNGTDDNHRSNALTLDWEGNMSLQGDLTIIDKDNNGISLYALKQYVDEFSSHGVVGDVKINGTSIVSDYVANIPLAGTNEQKGVVTIADDNGISITYAGTLRTNKSTSTQIKTGNNQYRPIVPYNQHRSVFYGLAKIAGDTTQSNTSNDILNEVGTYTPQAKAAIQTLLGVPSISDIPTYATNEETESIITNWEASA